MKHWPRRSTCTPHRPARMTPAARGSAAPTPWLRSPGAPLIPPDRPTGTGHVTITVTPDQLNTGLGVRWPSGLLMSRVEVAEHACTAKVSLVVGLTADQVHWQPLAVGFAQRYATKAQRAALAVRDGNGCIHPGCIVPAHRCIAHHIRPWAAGGPTDLPGIWCWSAGTTTAASTTAACTSPKPHRRLHHHRPTPTGHRIEPGVRAPGENEDRKPL